MPDHNDESVLPIPSDLYLEVGEVQDQLAELQSKLLDLQHRYYELSRAPRSLDVDTLGEPISPLHAAQLTENWLSSADSNLWRASEQLARARAYAGRLKLTDHACEQREHQLTQRRPPIDRTR
ncbi:hypothetical protein F3087_34085 [Nocardia colli]|uniref:Uncharacterized protein n=1 Tax=Nocardia colli TaxID=2545717 RepID=A0A5N0E7X3_9NOCA|nr:hypothetical protein [Nocardia colli]KAA8884255.1 hypothetical protein F3087_34085 [Nocardia colli]